MHAERINLETKSTNDSMHNVPSLPAISLLPIPHPRDLRMPHLYTRVSAFLAPLLPASHNYSMRVSRETTYLLLQLKDTKHQRLSRRRTPRHINIHRHNAITPPDNTITIMIVPATIRTATHRNNPSRLRHLIIDLPQRRRHLIRQRARHNHNIRLTRRRTEDDPQSILIVPRRRQVHHLDGTARESERHGPQ